ncbi:MAG: triose-phosphate isomerase [Chloroflexi bacterium]|nr:triose-phosphate isomerase [Chloroflexota bacterium]
MTRIPVIAGNWKMNKTPAEAAELARTFVSAFAATARVEVILCPPFVCLPAVHAALQNPPEGSKPSGGFKIGLGAQNLHWEKSGAFTGEISAPMLSGWCTHVIIGHSERRQFFGETDDTVNKKVRSALAHTLTPIICVGELLAEYEANKTNEVVTRQMKGAYDGLSKDDALKTIIAYEPVWAIGTGKAATGAGANTVIGISIRGVISDLYGAAVADSIRVQYGGSVTPSNIKEFMTQPDIDGALVGGASLKANDFQTIVEVASQK